MDSHIIVPKTVYKRFVNDEKYYYKYDMTKDKVVKGFPKSTFTEENYYSEFIEKMLNTYIENPLKKLMDFAEKIDLEAGEIVFDEILKEIARSYIISLAARNPQMCERLYSNNVVTKFFSQQMKHDLAVAIIMDNKEYYKAFDKFDVSFIVNTTDMPFILPTRGVYEYSFNGVDCLNSPLTPRFSIFLKECKKQIHNEEDNTFMVIYDACIIEEMNNCAFVKQKKDNIGYVVSSNKEILEELVKEIKL